MPEVAEGPLPDGIAEFWRNEERGGYPFGWFLVVEGIDGEGKKCLNWAWGPDTKTWNVKGWLQEALDDQVAGEIARTVKDED